MRRSHFGYVHRGQYAGGADGYDRRRSAPAMKTPAELAAPVATALARKRIAFKQHRRAPPDRVGEPACAEGAYGAAKQHRSHGEAGACRFGAERLRQGVDGPVNDAAVEAKKKASDRCYAGQRDYIDGTTSFGVDCRKPKQSFCAATLVKITCVLGLGLSIAKVVNDVVAIHVQKLTPT